MKLLASFALILTFGFVCFSQPSNDKPDWQKFETANKEVSFSLPKDYLVMNDLKNKDKKIVIDAFENGVNITVKIFKENNGKTRIGRMPTDSIDSTVTDFTLKNFQGRILGSNKNGFRQKLTFFSKKFLYIIDISAPAKENLPITHFLLSLKLDNQAIFNNSSVSANEINSDIKVVESLESSNSVQTALNRKIEKLDRKISVEPIGSFSEEVPVNDIRPAFIVKYPDSISLRNFFNDSDLNKGLIIKFKIQVLANGQVGDVIAFSSNKEIAKLFAENAKNYKFVPAEKNGLPIDSFKTDEVKIGVITSIRMIGTTQP